MQLEPLDKKLEAFGFHVVAIHGHNFEEFNAAKSEAKKSSKPTAIICNTVKGNHWIEYEHKVDSHYLPMKEDQYGLILAEVERLYTAQYNHVNK
jgi:transketolase